MGEIADGMINGLLCQECTCLVDGEEPGFPRTCGDCGGQDEYIGPFGDGPQKPSKKVPCPQCGKWVKEVGLWQHQRDVHGEAGQ